MDDNSDNIINLAHWKPKKQTPALSSTWVAGDAADSIERNPMSEAEMLDTWGLTEEEVGDLTWWGIDFRKSVLLQHLSDMRLAERQDQDLMTALGGQLALAVGASLISRMSVKEIGELVESLCASDATITSLFQTVTQDAVARL